MFVHWERWAEELLSGGFHFVCEIKGEVIHREWEEVWVVGEEELGTLKRAEVWHSETNRRRISVLGTVEIFCHSNQISGFRQRESKWLILSTLYMTNDKWKEVYSLGKRITRETVITFSWIRKRMKTGGADGTLMGQGLKLQREQWPH